MKRLKIYLLFLVIALVITFLTSFYKYQLPATSVFSGSNGSNIDILVAGFPLHFLSYTKEIFLGNLVIDIFFWFSLVTMAAKAWDLSKEK
ncbi:MAG: hypothetical protein Q8P13_00760 [bacterium]|nr:hypothetical protein [bacterium]